MTAARPFKIYNTLSKTVEDFEPLEAGKVGLYVCGMTVYDHAHVGHARAMVVFDAFVKMLRARGWEVTFVRNFTDVDDKIIRRAQESGEEPMAIAERYIASFQQDASNLGLTPPDHEPRVSQSIPEIQELTQQLIARGFAYETQGDVWFSVEAFEEYGKLSGQKVDELRSADAGAGKRHAADFALWKSSKPGEPSWESPWGAGRPGWHIECSAMANIHLGQHFDIHAGGLDLIFPHHENEIAQSECGHGSPYVNYWMHNGLLVIEDGAKMKGGVEGDAPQKMGKSLGNVFNIHNALERVPAEALRFYYLNAHYRSPLPWGEHSLPRALAQLMRLYEARERAEQLGGEGDPAQLAAELGESAQAVLEQSQGLIERFDEALDQDFNTPKAISFLFELARAINRFAEHKKARKRGGPVVARALEAFAHVSRTLDLLSMETEAFHQQVRALHIAALGMTEAQIEEMIAQRNQCRADKNWAQADNLRQALTDKQIALMDRPEGTTWRVALPLEDAQA